MMSLRWFEVRPRREQITVAVLIPVLLIVLVWSAWLPLSQARDQQRQAYRAETERLARVQALAERYRQLQAAGNQGTGQRGSLAQLVDRTAAEFELRMARFQPTSDGGAQLRFDNAEQEAVLRWLYHLENEQGVAVSELSIATGASAGRVNVSLRLDAP